MKIGRQKKALSLWMNSTWNTYADSLKGFVDMLILQQPHLLDDVLERELRIGYGHDRFARKKPAREINDCKDSAVGTNVESKRHEKIIDFQHGRRAAARTANDCSLAHPPLRDKLLNND